MLARAAAYDQRTAGRADAEAWAAALPDIAAEEAVPAVAAWYSRRRDRVMPADIRALVTSARNEAWERANPDQRALPAKAGDRHTPDDAEYGCLAWIGGWRQTQGGAPPPPYRLAEAVGRSAIAWAKQGLPRPELARMMWEAGRNSVILDPPSDAEAEAS